MKFCLFDNPVTSHREWYRDKKLIHSSHCRLFLPETVRNYLPWEDGKLRGNIDSLPDELKEFVTETKGN